MSGPIDPFDGEAGAAAPAVRRWPTSCRGPRPGPDDRAEVEPEADDQPRTRRESRSARRAARSARVRRRRRILLGIGGGLLVIILAFVLWYELEAHALGSPGPQVVVTVHQGESTDSVVDALSQQHVIGSSLAFQVSEVFHGTPSVLPGSYAMHQNLAFSEVRTLLAAGPNIYPVDVRPGFTFSEVAQQVDSLPGHAAGRLRQGRGERRRALDDHRDRSQQPGGHARHRDLPGPSRRERHHHPHGHGAALRPRQRGGRPHQRVGRPRWA